MFTAVLKRDYRQLIYLVAAFMLMAGVSSYYFGVMMNRQIDLFSRSEMRTYQRTLHSLILAQETALLHSASAVVTALEHGVEADELRVLLTSMTDMLKSQKDIKDVFHSAYGYIDDVFLDGTGWTPGEFYNPRTAPWFSEAILNNGLFRSRPFIDMRTGHVIISISTVLLTRNGENRGVLAMDYFLDPIAQRVEEYKLADSGFSFLLDDSFTTLVFPDPELIGRKISDRPDFAGLEKRLENLGEQEMMEETLSIGEIRHIVFFSQLENGWFLGIAVPANDYHGQVTQIRWVIFALALALSGGLGLILVRLAAAKQSFEYKSLSKTNFLARMSHEIRTPLNAILGMSLLARRHYGDSTGLKYLAEINRTGNHLLVIINDILDLSKVETGNLKLKEEPYNVKTVLSDIQSIARIRTMGLSLTMETEVDQDIPAKLVGDEGRVRQILMNLVSNAIKYTPVGFVRLRVTGQPAEEAGHFRLIFSVEDSGTGVKPEQLEFLFEEFVRLEQGQNAARPIEGAGLGLPITRSLCRAMGGDVTVTSEFGLGSTFRAEIIQGIADPFPMGAIGEDPPQAPEEDELSPAFTTPGFKVLVIDDIATNLVVTEGLLSLYEVRTTTCLSGREGVEAARKERFDLIFIDHIMPEFDGLETLKALREAEEYLKKTPMVALTANAMDGMREMFLENGFDDYLSKPIQLKELEEIMARWAPKAARALT